MRLIDGDRLFAEIKERHDMFAGCEYIGDKARRDELGAFMADIVNAPTVGGWISVKDRLPEDEDDVLIYGVSPRGRKKTAIMNYLAFDADRPRWSLDGIWTVIYWMPLPEPPKEESKCD